MKTKQTALTASVTSVQELNTWTTYVSIDFKLSEPSELVNTGVLVVNDHLQSVNLFYVDKKGRASASLVALPQNKVGKLNVEHGFALDALTLKLVEEEVSSFLTRHYN